MLSPFQSLFHSGVDDKDPMEIIGEKLDQIDNKLDQLDAKVNELNPIQRLHPNRAIRPPEVIPLSKSVKQNRA